jgi:Na+(H+)/acetate symporter ActP
LGAISPEQIGFGGGDQGVFQFGVRAFIVFVVVFIVISAIIAIFQHKAEGGAVAFIAQLMGVSWGALAGAFLAPFLLSLYSKKISKASVFVCFAFGVTVMIANMLFRAYFPVWLKSPINCGAMTMIAGFIIVPLVSLITPKPNKAQVDETFKCYEKNIGTSKN